MPSRHGFSLPGANASSCPADSTRHIAVPARKGVPGECVGSRAAAPPLLPAEIALQARATHSPIAAPLLLAVRYSVRELEPVDRCANRPRAKLRRLFAPTASARCRRLRPPCRAACLSGSLFQAYSSALIVFHVLAV